MKSFHKILIYFAFFSLYSSTLYCQKISIADSLFSIISNTSDDQKISEVYQELYNYKFQNNDTSGVRSIIKLARKHAVDSGNQQNMARAEAIAVRYLYWQEKYNECYLSCKKIEIQAKEANLPLLRAELISLMADVQGLQGNYAYGLELAQSSLDLKLANNASEEQLARSYTDLANFHGAVNNLFISTQYYEKAKIIFEQMNNIMESSKMQMYIGLNLNIQGKYTEAKSLFIESLKVARKTKNSKLIINILGNLGNVEQNLENYEQSLLYYNEAQLLCEKENFKYRLSYIYQRKAHLNVVLQKWEEAIEYAQKAYLDSMSKGDKESMRREYEYLYKGYKGLKKYDKAFKYLEKFTAIDDSLFNAQKISAFNELETKYLDERQAREIELLENKNKINSLVTRSTNLGALGIIILLGIFTFALKERLKKKEIERAKLSQEVSFEKTKLKLKTKELIEHTLHIANKNRTLDKIKSTLEVVSIKAHNSKYINDVVTSIEIDRKQDDFWESFRLRFLDLHSDFEEKIKTQFPKLTNSEMKFVSLIKLNMSSREIRNVLNISPEGIKKARYRLRKKLKLDPSDSLEQYIRNV